MRRPGIDHPFAQCAAAHCRRLSCAKFHCNTNTHLTFADQHEPTSARDHTPTAFPGELWLSVQHALHHIQTRDGSCTSTRGGAAAGSGVCTCEVQVTHTSTPQKQRDQQLSEASLCHETALGLCGATVTLQRTSSACRLRRNCPFHPTTDPHLACLLLAFPAPALPPSFRPWGERERRRKQEVSEEGEEGVREVGREGGGEGGE